MTEELLDSALAAAARLPPHWYSFSPAEQSGVPQSVISRCERGMDVRVSTLLRLFACLGCRVTLAVMIDSDEGQDLAAEERQQRKDRQMEGLAVRWYRQRGR